MKLRICLLLVCTLTLSFTSSQKTDHRDEIYIDDDEGSGGGHRDLDKDDLESSGSGFGPDDEDGPSSAVDPLDPYKSVPKPAAPGVSEPAPAPRPDVDAAPVPGGGVAPGVEEPAVRHDLTGVQGVTDSPSVPKQPVEHPNHNLVDPAVHMDPASSGFFLQPGILAAVIGGCVVGLFFSILVVMFIVYRMRKKDEGSYALDEPKRSPTANSYTKNSQREFYA